jgi:hypothetical protein
MVAKISTLVILFCVPFCAFAGAQTPPSEVLIAVRAGHLFVGTEKLALKVRKSGSDGQE